MSVKADKRRHSPIRWIFILLFLIVVLIGVILGVSYTKLGKINSTPMNQSKLVTVHEDANMKDYTNIALFGIDSQTGSMSDRATVLIPLSLSASIIRQKKSRCCLSTVILM